jgi:uncharacterized membrane protein YqjE
MDNAFDRNAARSSVPPTVGAARAGRAYSESPDASFLEPLERVFASLRRMASNYATLAVIDLRRATIQLAWLVGSGIMIAVLVVTAWLAGVVAVAVLLLGNNMSWPAVLGVAALLNLVGAGIVVWCVKSVFEEAPFAATLKQIKTAAGDSDQPGAV